MTEWKDPDTMPKNGNPFLVLTSYGEYFVCKSTDNSITLAHSPKCNKNIDHIYAWCELPELPYNPQHDCRMGDLRCIQLESGKLGLMYYKRDGEKQTLQVECCPFCGEEA
jgi:hypothetical protein